MSETMTVEQIQRKESAAYKTLTWAIGLFVSLGVVVHGFVIRQMVDLYHVVNEVDKRVVAIEHTRFTTKQGMDLLANIGKLKSDIDKLPSEVPPKWFIQKVEEQGNRITALEHKVWKGKPGT